MGDVSFPDILKGWLLVPEDRQPWVVTRERTFKKIYIPKMKRINYQLLIPVPISGTVTSSLTQCSKERALKDLEAGIIKCVLSNKMCTSAEGNVKAVFNKWLAAFLQFCTNELKWWGSNLSWFLPAESCRTFDTTVYFLSSDLTTQSSKICTWAEGNAKEVLNKWLAVFLQFCTNKLKLRTSTLPDSSCTLAACVAAHLTQLSSGLLSF